jgi:hypothetical protein
MRKIIIHYHIFKNAGTTLDEILRTSFGSSWQNLDKTPTPAVKILPYELQIFLEHNPQLKAISSHDALLPVPIGEFQIYPLFFLRHPIIRARSVWKFESQVQLGLSAPKVSFVEYLETCFGKRQIGVFSDFQTYKLSNQIYQPLDIQRRPDTTAEKLQIAQTTVSSAPFFGLVEHMHTSLERMHYYLKMSFPEIKVVNRVYNASSTDLKSVDDSLIDIRNEIGSDLFAKLEASNSLDMQLYQYAVDRFFSVIPKG